MTGCNVILKNIHNHISVDSETYHSPIMSINLDTTGIL